MKVVRLVITCEAAPVQAEGELENGAAFEFRARHKRIALSVEGVEYAVALLSASFPDDAHALSSFNLDHVKPLIEFMSDVLYDCQQYENRSATWQLKPSQPPS